jgi:hypothetical protein
MVEKFIIILFFLLILGFDIKKFIQNFVLFLNGLKIVVYFLLYLI